MKITQVGRRAALMKPAVAAANPSNPGRLRMEVTQAELLVAHPEACTAHAAGCSHLLQ